MTQTHSASTIASRLEMALSKYQTDITDGHFPLYSKSAQEQLRGDFTAGWVACLDALAELDRQTESDPWDD